MVQGPLEMVSEKAQAAGVSTNRSVPSFCSDSITRLRVVLHTDANRASGQNPFRRCGGQLSLHNRNAFFCASALNIEEGDIVDHSLDRAWWIPVRASDRVMFRDEVSTVTF